MDIETREHERRAEIQAIAAAHGAHNLRVFGSTARGEAGAGSDLDLLIALDPGRDLLDIVAIKQDLEDLLGCRVDVITEAALSPYLRAQVLRDAVSLCMSASHFQTIAEQNYLTNHGP